MIRWIPVPLLLAAALVLPSPAQAAPGWLSGCGPFDGPYIGIAGGLFTPFPSLEQETAAEFAGFAQDTATISYKNRQCDLEPVGEVFLGWGRTLCGRIHLGGRVGMSFANRKVKRNLAQEVVDFEGGIEGIEADLSSRITATLRDVDWFVDFRPGLLLSCRSLLFGIVGASFNETTLSTSSRALFDYIDEGVLIDSTLTASRKRSTGLRLGIGIEHILFCNVSAHLTWVYTQYERITVEKAQDIPDLGGGTIADGFRSRASMRMRTQTVTAGLSYHF